MPGRNLARAPVAMMVRGVSSDSLPAGLPAEVVSTSSLLRPVTWAVPLMCVTPYFLNRNSTPPASFSETARLRPMILLQSKLIGPCTTTPISPACWTARIVSADLSSALVGMQPQLRQMPPARSRSMQAVLNPSCAPRIAAT